MVNLLYSREKQIILRNVASTTKQEVNTSTWMPSGSLATSEGSRAAPEQGQALRWPRFQTVPHSRERQARLFLLPKLQQGLRALLSGAQH